MIPSKTGIEVQGNVPFKGKAMDFDPGAIKHIMRLLIDLYSDAEQAIIRELSTNARDSHIMAGVTRPIDIQTPSALSPYFVVTDYGVGLSEEEVYSLFGRYGASTKRGTNDATGMLGLGSKSPLTYTNQFTMTVVKDGERVVVSIARNEDGVGEITTVAKVPTNEGNGVSIKIPAKTGNQIEQKARKFFRYWEPGTVLINNQEPAQLEDALLIADRITVADKDGNKNVVPCPIYMVQQDRYNGEGSMVVMGNVPYPAGDKLNNDALGMPNGYAVAATVPIGSVEFVPSREALAQNDPQTKRVLDAIASAAKQGFKKAIQDEVAAAPTAPEALKLALQWRDALGWRAGGNLSLKWRGQDLPDQFTIPHRNQQDSYGRVQKFPTGKMFMVNPRYDTGRGRVASYAQFAMSQLPAVMFVQNFPFSEITPTHKKKIKQWFYAQTTEVQQSINHLCMIDFSIPAEYLPFIEPSRLMDWQPIQDQKLPKNVKGVSGRIPGSFDVLFGGNNRSDGRSSGIGRTGIPGDELDQTKPLFWMQGNRQEAYRPRLVLDNIGVAEYTIICLPANRVNKFVRENPKIENVITYLKNRVTKLIAGMSDNEKLAIAMHEDGHLSGLKDLARHAYAIHDPKVVAACHAATTNVDKFIKMRDNFRLTVDWPSFDWEDPLENYLLFDLDWFGSRYYTDKHREQAIRYLNSEYAHRKTAEKAKALRKVVADGRV